MSVRGPGFWGYRWEGYSHQELYDQVRVDVRGAAAVAEASQAWAEFVAVMAESKERTDQLLREAGVEWQGRTAESMSAGVSPLAAWADRAAAAGRVSGDSLQGVAEAFARTANSMPEPMVVPSKATAGFPTDFAGMVAGQVDEDAAGRAAQQAHQHAIELMNSYTAHNRDAAGAAGTFDDPPEVGISAGNSVEMTRSDGDYIDTAAFDDGDAPRREDADTRGPGGPGPGGAEPGEPEATGPGPSGAGVREPGASGPGPGGLGASGPGVSGGGALGAGRQWHTNPADVAGALSPSGSGTGFGASTAPGNPVVGPRPDSTGGPHGAGPGHGRIVGTGPVAAPENTAARGGAQAAVRGGQPAMAGPVGGAGRRDEDKERTSPEYLHDFNDEFWDDTPPVAPPVIGDDDD